MKVDLFGRAKRLPGPLLGMGFKGHARARSPSSRSIGASSKALNRVFIVFDLEIGKREGGDVRGDIFPHSLTHSVIHHTHLFIHAMAEREGDKQRGRPLRRRRQEIDGD